MIPIIAVDDDDDEAYLDELVHCPACEAVHPERNIDCCAHCEEFFWCPTCVNRNEPCPECGEMLYASLAEEAKDLAPFPPESPG